MQPDAVEVAARDAPAPQREPFSWWAFVDRVSFKYAPMGLEFSVELAPISPAPMLLLMIRTRERDSGLHTTVLRSDRLPTVNSELEAARFVCDGIVKLIEHEVLEQFHLDDQRILDPHQEKK